MKNLLIIVATLLSTLGVKAHQPDISTVMLIQKEDNSWILQVRASLTAFQQEIRLHHKETPYKTPEEFSDQVIQHLQNYIKIQLPSTAKATLENGSVKLGHETSVLFTVNGLPDTFEELAIENKAFIDIYRSQTAIILLKQGFEKKQVILNSDNNHSTQLAAHGNHFEVLNKAIDSSTTSYLVIVVLLILAIAVIILAIFKNKANKNQAIVT